MKTAIYKTQGPSDTCISSPSMMSFKYVFIFISQSFFVLTISQFKFLFSILYLKLSKRTQYLLVYVVGSCFPLSCVYFEFIAILGPRQKPENKRVNVENSTQQYGKSLLEYLKKVFLNS